MISLCVFCIRKRRQAIPVRPAPAAKKPALRRAEARERLNEVTEVSNVAAEPDAERIDAVENKATVETRSVLERECAICLSALHAPAPPEPAKLSETPITDEAAKPPSVKDATAGEPETILKLHVCQHEFHTECLVSWFVLRKTSCPICRAVYYSKEAMQAHDDEEAAQLAAAAPAPTPAALEAQTPAPVVSNWRFFLHGHSVGRHQGRSANAIAVEMQPTQPSTETPSAGTATQESTQQPAVEVAPQPPRSRWQRLRGEL
ncbi:hypothetical protein T440DRAFT_111746 [Plenodomus tracheiphilus IPT5]|uniref:RING-type domain-containing protein n=1 Tax=Plenodomus tracheiphilus IPT5 TaxID=1408161 RepID=A0A6A7B4X1_9PLEO|nr:hypothetical protein T440DRAFT_111746 [Plenodomus tracheiphilus IPT5]